MFLVPSGKRLTLRITDRVQPQLAADYGTVRHLTSYQLKDDGLQIAATLSLVTGSKSPLQLKIPLDPRIQLSSVSRGGAEVPWVMESDDSEASSSRCTLGFGSVLRTDGDRTSCLVTVNARQTVDPAHSQTVRTSPGYPESFSFNFRIHSGYIASGRWIQQT